MTVLTVALAGFPPTPNRTRGQHWAEAARTAQQWRWDAYLASLQAIRDHPWPSSFPLASASVQLVVIRPTNQWPDDDNAIAAVKPVLDGMTDAKVWTDDRVARITGVVHETGPRGLRIEILTGRAA